MYEGIGDDVRESEAVEEVRDEVEMRTSISCVGYAIKFISRFFAKEWQGNETSEH